MKKMIGVFTSIVAALAVVGVAWAGTDDDTSTSVSAATESTTDVSVDDSATRATVASSTSATVDASTSTSLDDHGGDDDDSSTSTSIAAATSTSASGSSATSTMVGSSTSTSFDDNDRKTVPDGVTTHIIPGVGSVIVEVSAGQLILVNVSAPGWSVEHDKLESDRIELEFTNTLDAEAEFEARINDGRVEVRIEVD